VFVVDDRVGRLRVDEDLKLLYLAAKDAAQDAIRLPVAVFETEPDTAVRTMRQMEFRVATRARDTETFVVSVQGDVDPVTAPARRASNARGRFAAQVRQQRQAVLHLRAGLRRRVPEADSAGHETAWAD
jgi:hypothetical protein